MELDGLDNGGVEDYLRPMSDLAAVRECYEQHGVVGVTGVLDPEECQTLLTKGIEPYLPEGCRFDDVDSYSLADRALNRYGVLGKQALFNPAILSARLHPNVAAAFSAVYGQEDVIACHDRMAWMRPAAICGQWDTPFSWPGLHLDVSARGFYELERSSVDAFLGGLDYLGGGGFVAENNAKHTSMGRTVQAVLNLMDNAEEDGGFQCVPGMFGANLERWVAQHTSLPEPQVNGRYELRSFGPDAELGAEAVRVPCPAGTLILFDATLPHGTRPNTSTRSRAILFLRYVCPGVLPPESWRNRNAALRRVVKEVGFEPDERQSRLLYGPEGHGSAG